MTCRACEERRRYLAALYKKVLNRGGDDARRSSAESDARQPAGTAGTAGTADAATSAGAGTGTAGTAGAGTVARRR